jgi:hypothetical protein
MFFEMAFERISSLAYVQFSTGARNLVDSLAKHGVSFILSYWKYFFKFFIRFKESSHIIFGQYLRNMIYSTLDVGNRNDKSLGRGRGRIVFRIRIKMEG